MCSISSFLLTLISDNKVKFEAVLQIKPPALIFLLADRKCALLTKVLREEFLGELSYLWEVTKNYSELRDVLAQKILMLVQKPASQNLVPIVGTVLSLASQMIAFAADQRGDRRTAVMDTLQYSLNILVEYVRGIVQNLRIAQVARVEDLMNLTLAGTDFSCCDFSDAILSSNLTSANFNHCIFSRDPVSENDPCANLLSILWILENKCLLISIRLKMNSITIIFFRNKEDMPCLGKNLQPNCSHLKVKFHLLGWTMI